MKTKLPYPKAHALAQAIVADLKPGCVRAEIAGSVRRKKPEVGDVEVICIPAYQGDLFGGRGQSLLDPILSSLVERGLFLPPEKSGDRYKQYVIAAHACNLDLFLVEPETWGVLYAIRSGPAEFSKRLVTERSKGGFLPDGYSVAHGRLWDADGCAVETPSEEAFFAALGMEFIEPERRV